MLRKTINDGKRWKDLNETYKTFLIEIPTPEVISRPSLVERLNELSDKIINQENSGITQWSFPSLTIALKAVLLVHQASAYKALISHRLLCDDYCYMQYGDFQIKAGRT